MARLKKLADAIGRQRLVLDLSCRKKGDAYYIVTDRWQKFTEVILAGDVLDELAGFCDEFLIHAADVEGKCAGIDRELVEKLAEWSPLPTTYAGGVRDLSDLQLMRKAGKDRIDVTIGSALDIFGGKKLTYRQALAYCRGEEKKERLFLFES